MGQRTVQTPDKPNHRPASPETTGSATQPEEIIQIDASRMIEKLRVRLSQMQATIDFMELVLEDKNEQIVNMLARIAELEDKEK